MDFGIELSVIMAYIFGLVLLYFIGWILIIPIKLICKLIVNGIIGGILLIIVNLIGEFVNFSIGLNPINAIVVGFLGIPGVLLLIVFKLIL